MKQQMIGLTGPTGSGKGEVARVLAALGCAIVDADRLSLHCQIKTIKDYEN